MEEMVQKDFLPSLFSYVNDLACTGSTKKELVPGITTKAEEKLITKLSGLADTISDELDILKDMIGTTEGMDDYLKAGTYYHDTILAEMETLRLAVNDAEVLIPEDISRIRHTMHCSFTFNCFAHREDRRLPEKSGPTVFSYHILLCAICI